MILPNGQPLRLDMPGARFGGTVEEVMAALAAQNNNNNAMSTRKVSAALAAQVLADTLAAFVTIRTNLPFLISLSDDERAHLPHLGDKSIGLIQATKDFVTQHPEALPADFSLVEFNKSCDLFAPFESIADASDAADQAIQDTRVGIRHDLFNDISNIYACAKANNRTGRYQTYVDYMAAHYSKPRKPKTPPTPPTP